MAGIDDDAADLEAKGAHQGTLAGGGGFGFMRGRREIVIRLRSIWGCGVEGAWLLAGGAVAGSGGAVVERVVEANEPSSGWGAGTVPATEAAMGRVVGWSVA